MIIDITRLASLLDDYIEIDEVYSFSAEELKGSGILKLDNVKVSGFITKDSLGEYVIDAETKGVMVLPCSVSLKPVDYKFDIKISGSIAEIYEEMGEKFKNNQKTIDILPIIWENILMEIPLKVVSEDIDDIVTSGQGWELLKDEDE